MLIALALALASHTITVGDGREFATIADAVAHAAPGDTIAVYPKAAGYTREAVRIDKANLTILGMAGRIPVDGSGFDYSGVGRIPRAIFQFESSGKGSTLRSFELRGAHNELHNGAGVRINSCDDATMVDCDVHGCDMGVMSGGSVSGEAKNQRIERSSIHANGDPADPGYNHNLYLGGDSALVSGCDIYDAVAGHNLKSRAHFIEIRDCHVHGGNNRQIDLVEASDTERPNSNALIIGCRIEMNPTSNGNRNTLHFGQERGIRNGKLYVFGSTIVTPFLSSLLLMDSPTCSAMFVGDRIINADQHAPIFAEPSSALDRITGRDNWISPSYKTPFPNPNAPPATAKAEWLDGEGAPHRITFIVPVN